MNNC
jgi:hypothetical protein